MTRRSGLTGDTGIGAQVGAVMAARRRLAGLAPRVGVDLGPDDLAAAPARQPDRAVGRPSRRADRLRIRHLVQLAGLGRHAPDCPSARLDGDERQPAAIRRCGQTGRVATEDFAAAVAIAPLDARVRQVRPVVPDLAVVSAGGRPVGRAVAQLFDVPPRGVDALDDGLFRLDLPGDHQVLPAALRIPDAAALRQLRERPVRPAHPGDPKTPGC